MSATSIGMILPDLEKLVGFHHHLALTELRVTTVHDGWRFMVKGQRNGVGYVAFVFCAYFDDGLELLTDMADKGAFSFKPDRYPVKVKKP